MSTHSGTAAARRRPTVAQQRAIARRRARRRRRVLGFAVCAVIVVAAGTMLAGGLNNAVKQITTLPLEHASIIRDQAQAKELDPALIAAVIYTESRFRPRTSSAGAEGLMQITPDTAQFIARTSGATAFTVEDLATPKVNIAYGAWYLRYLKQRYGGNVKLALAAYNGGMGNVDKWLASARAQGHDFGLSDIPFPETRAYVENVLAREREYRSTYRKQLG